MLISRDAVTGADNGRTIVYAEEKPTRFYDLITYLNKNNFFPQIPDRSMWSINYEGEEVGLYKPGGRNSYRTGKLENICAEDGGTIFFRYFSDDRERAEYLYRFYCGHKQNMYFAGQMEEYQSYQIPKELEQSWRKKLITEKYYQHFDEAENINEAISLLNKILIRPGMFVGQHRLDFVEIYFAGWSAHQRSIWSLSYDLKQWLFLKESVCGSSSMDGWSVFYETYGVTEPAIARFREFMETNIPTSVFDHRQWDTVTEHVGTIWASALHPEGPRADLRPYMDFDQKWVVNEDKVCAEVIRQVKRIAGSTCKRIKVFVHTGRAVAQVRFFFDDGSGWQDGISLNTTPDYYAKMVVLHGYLKLAEKMVSNTSIITIEWDDNVKGIKTNCETYQAPEFHFRYETPPKEEYLLSNQFADWKAREIDK